MKTGKLIGSLAIALALFVAPKAATADTLIFDNTLVIGGTLSYDGAGGPAVGTGILFDTITYVEGSQTIACSNCVLNFTTGANTLELGGALWVWGGGGSFEIYGGVPAAGIADGTLLLSGTFSGPVPASAALGAGDVLTLTGGGIDSKNAALLEFFGIGSTPFVFASTNITTTNCVVGGDASFNCSVDEADVTNTNEPFQVPEPGLLALFGVGLLGVSAAARRRMARR